MGLAEPRKRLKIAHDPNNLSWSQSENSYGQRLMASQGWKAGDGLGAKKKYGKSHNAAKVAVAYKDDQLGLGAKLTSRNVEQSRAGLDAFQGLLGRLNGKSDFELKKEEQKVEDRKLAMWAQGKWGGMTFVPGGLLVQGEAFKKEDDGELPSDMEESTKAADNNVDEISEKARRKQERRKKRAERERTEDENEELADRARRKEQRRKRRTEQQAVAEVNESEQAADTESHETKEEKKSKQSKSTSTDETLQVPTPPAEPTSTPAPRPLPRNGRHLLRGKNIQAKKMVFGDARMLDEIFMRSA